MKAWAGMDSVLIELTPDEARDLSHGEPFGFEYERRLRYLANMADGLVLPRDAADVKA